MGKYAVLWFSGTGNTLIAARSLTARLKQAGADASLYSMCGKWQPGPGQTLIFCWPVYSYGPPRLVNNFMRMLPRGDNPVYMFCTMGGGAGGALVNALSLMAAKGYKALGGAELLMPNNYTGGRKPLPSTIGPLLSAAQAKIDSCMEVILHNQPLPGRRSGLVGIVSRMVNRVFYLGLPGISRRFHISPGACTGCGRCAKACPVQNIVLAGQRPVWGRSCELCLRCLHSCPQGAIDLFGALRRGRPQYTAPGICLNDLRGAE